MADDMIIPEGEILPPKPTMEALAYLHPISRPPNVQLRFPRSKKKRIQKKWRDNPKNWGQIIYTLSKNPKALLRRMELKREREREKARRFHRDENWDATQPETGICRIPPLLEG